MREIPSVCGGWVCDPHFKTTLLESHDGREWLTSISSFRYEPEDEGLKPFTVRKETTRTGDYWYGYKKIGGKLHKKYIGKDSEVNSEKLTEIAGALNSPPEPRVTDKVTEVTERGKRVTDKVTHGLTIEEFTALKSQVQALQESLEALRGESLGKSEAGDSEELPTVTDSALQIELGNLKAENETLRQELAQAQGPQHKLYQEIEQLKERNRLLTIKSREERQKLEEELKSLKYSFESAGRRLAEKQKRLDELETELSDLKHESAVAYNELFDDREAKLAELRAEPSDLKQKSATARELPDAFDFLNQIKAKLPKLKLTHTDAKKILEVLEES
jgi:predicted  nucleic acid-binding Zn-ribbon protein